MSKRFAVVLLVGCGGATAAGPKPGAIGNDATASPQPPGTLFAVSEEGVGPVTAATRFDPQALGESFAPLEVRYASVDVDDESSSSPDLEVIVDGAVALLIVQDDGNPGDILNVHGLARVAGPDPRRQLGEPMDALIDELAVCECWGDSPVCFSQDSHVAVRSDEACSSGGQVDAQDEPPGGRIDRLIWMARPFVGRDE